MKYRLAALTRNLAAGARLAFFLRVRPFDYRASVADYSLLLAFNFAAWAAAAALRSGFEGELDAGALAVFLACVPLVLACAAVVAHIFGASERLLLVATALTASDAFFELVGLVTPAIAALVGEPRGVLLLFLAWIWVVSVRAVVVCLGTRRPQVLKGALAVTAMIAISFFAFPRAEIWKAPEDDAVEPLAEEATFHLQGQLIEEALAGIAAGRPGVPELFFVGFAPDASHAGFVTEMRFVRRFFDERFGTAGRSIALANSEAALDEFPIASVTNLGRALERVGEAMNGDEDVLFLFVTAHGSPDHRLAAVQPPLELAALTPTSLARMLQQAGIKWRVIVVSACYSGGFIEPLRDANSIVITASAQDRPSFGCQDGRDFTYFGEAYFRDALSRTRSFAEAFTLAKDAVARREAEERLQPSMPQIWVGPAIAERLKDAADRPHQ